MEPFKLLQGQRDQRTVVCTWCAEKFLDQASLAQHRADSPSCDRNATVSSGLQSRYGATDLAPIPLGEYTLQRVRAKSCRHPETILRPLFASDGQGGWTDQLIGHQCSWCYTLLPIEVPND